MLFSADLKPTEPRRVVITGGGIMTAYGKDWGENAEGFRMGKSTFRKVKNFDVSRQRVQQASEIDLPDKLPDNGLSSRRISRLDRASRILLWATDSAFRSAGWSDIHSLPVVLGTTCGAMPIGQDYYKCAVSEPYAKRKQAQRAIDYQVHRQGALIGQAFGFSGAVDIIQNACASGANAVGEAWERIRHGFSDRMLAGGYDALCELVYAGFDSLQALSPTVCRPFDQRRDGLALGEGVAMFALESLDSARERNANILGEIVGYSAATDCHHLTQPNPEGNAALSTMTEACRIAGLSPDDIDYINAHGTGTRLNDASESESINRWLSGCERRVAVSSTKAGVGHLLGAAGAVEIAVGLMALNGQWVPPSIASEQPEVNFQFDFVNEPESREVNYVLSNSFGFGGANASIILKRWG